MASAPTLGAEQTAQTPAQAKAATVSGSARRNRRSASLARKSQRTTEQRREAPAKRGCRTLQIPLVDSKAWQSSAEVSKVKLDELQRLIAGQESALAAREQALGEVMRALHRQGDMSLARAFLSGQGPTNAARQLNYLSRIAAAQRATLASV